MLVRVLLVVGLAVVVVGCRGSDDGSSVTAPIPATSAVQTLTGDPPAESPSGETAQSSDPAGDGTEGAASGAATDDPELGRPAEYVARTVQASVIVELQLQELIEATEQIRGHEFVEAPTVRFVEPTELRRLRRVATRLDLADEDLAPDTELFEMLGIFEAPVDLADFYEDYAAGSSVAFYDLDYRELYVPLTGDSLTPYERWVLVHELTHALMHQVHPGTAAVYQDEAEDDTDTGAAILGLIEGEAVLVQTLYYAGLDAVEQEVIVEEATVRRRLSSAPVAPPYMETVARFPYGPGARFVVGLHGQGGMAAVDQAFATPPWATSHVFHISSYLELEQPQLVSLRTPHLPGYELHSDGRWGELRWRALLGESLNGARVDQAADGWLSDETVVLWSGSEVVFAATLAHESGREASEMAGALGDWIAARTATEPLLETGELHLWLGDAFVALARADDEVTLVMASNQAAGWQAAGQLGLIHDVDGG